jgi:hypothetical protein
MEARLASPRWSAGVEAAQPGVVPGRLADRAHALDAPCSKPVALGTASSDQSVNLEVWSDVSGKWPRKKEGRQEFGGSKDLAVTDTTVLEAVLRRDRWVVVAALVAVIAVAWVWILVGAGTGMSAVAMTQMAGMPDMDMMMARAVWTPEYAGLIFAMRPGRLGAFRMGLEHGAFCQGCCWFLMGLLFFGGIINGFRIAGRAGFVLLEKTIPMGHWVGRIAGIGVAAWGLLLLASAGSGS